MDNYIKFLENKIEGCEALNPGMEREKWAFIQCLKEYRKFSSPVKPEVSQPSELLPCPFCGEQAIINKKEASFEILCPNCLIHGFQTFEKEAAVKLWNKRANQ